MNLDANIQLFSEFYGETFPIDKRPRCIITQHTKLKLVWDIWITALLIFITISVPLRLAFSETETLEIMVTYILVDLFFFIDIIVIFFTTYTNDKN